MRERERAGAVKTSPSLFLSFGYQYGTGIFLNHSTIPKDTGVKQNVALQISVLAYPVPPFFFFFFFTLPRVHLIHILISTPRSFSAQFVNLRRATNPFGLVFLYQGK